MTSKQGQQMLKNLSNVFTKDPQSLLAQFFNAIGSQVDLVDPVQTLLASQFSITNATGAALDKHGKDWGVPRRYQESDDSYRARIKAVAPVYTNGPTVVAISAIVQGFTGTAPVIIEYGPMGFTMGVSPMGNFVFDSNTNDNFTFQVQVQNPNNVAYSRSDLEAAVNNAKPARATATFVHQGGI